MNPNDSEQPDPDSGRVADDTLDQIAVGLQRLRADYSYVSYAEIVARITAARQARGVTREAARLARTTVYDCFRVGRVRVNPQLVGEIVQALTNDTAQATQWEVRCQAARAKTESRATAVAKNEAAEHATAKSEPQGDSTAQLKVATAPAEETGQISTSNAPPPSLWLVVILVVCTVGNIGLPQVFQALFGKVSPLPADMTGTAVAALVLGPWWGVLTGVLSNLIRLLWEGPVVLLSGLTSIVSALILGYGVRRFGLAKTLPRYLGLSVLTGIACSAIVIPIWLIIGDGRLAILIAQEVPTQVVQPIWPLIIVDGLVISVAAAILTGFIALIVAGTIFKRWAPTDLVGLTRPPSY